jgi:hypothetical protein
MAAAVRRHYKKHGEYALSVFTFRLATGQMIATKTGLPHDEYCAARARAFRLLGLSVRMSDTILPGHADLVFPDGFFPGDPVEEDFASMRETFGRPHPNRTSRAIQEGR